MWYPDWHVILELCNIKIVQCHHKPNGASIYWRPKLPRVSPFAECIECNLLYCWGCTKLGMRNWEWNKNREYKKRNETSPVCRLCSGRPVYANQYQCRTWNTLTCNNKWAQQSKLQLIQSQHLCANYSCVLWHNLPNPQMNTLYNWQADTPKQLLTLTATTCISTPV